MTDLALREAERDHAANPGDPEAFGRLEVAAGRSGGHPVIDVARREARARLVRALWWGSVKRVGLDPVVMAELQEAIFRATRQMGRLGDAFHIIPWDSFEPTIATFTTFLVPPIRRRADAAYITHKRRCERYRRPPKRMGVGRAPAKRWA